MGYRYIINQILTSDVQKWGILDKNFDIYLISMFPKDVDDFIEGKRVSRTFFKDVENNIPVVKIDYEDVLEDGKLIAIKKTFTWTRQNVLTGDISFDAENTKEHPLPLQKRKDVEEVLKKRRHNIQAFLLNEAKEDENTQAVFGEIFDRYKQQIDKWLLLGIADDFHSAVQAETEEPYTTYLNYPVQSPKFANLKEYLKEFIKNQEI